MEAGTAGLDEKVQLQGMRSVGACAENAGDLPQSWLAGRQGILRPGSLFSWFRPLQIVHCPKSSHWDFLQYTVVVTIGKLCMMVVLVVNGAS